MSVCDKQGSQGPQTLEGLLSMTLCGFLVDGGTGNLNRLIVKMRRLPDEVLQQIALVLGKHQVLGLVHDISNVIDELSAFFRKLV